MTSCLMEYFLCTACKTELFEQNAVYFPNCSHTYCTDCCGEESHCPCDPSSLCRKFADNPLELAIFKTKKLLDKLTIKGDVSIEDWEDVKSTNERISIQPPNGDVDSDPSFDEDDSHTVELLRCQLETVMQRWKERDGNSKCSFRSKAERYFR